MPKREKAVQLSKPHVLKKKNVPGQEVDKAADDRILAVNWNKEMGKTSGLTGCHRIGPTVTWPNMLYAYQVEGWVGMAALRILIHINISLLALILSISLLGSSRLKPNFLPRWTVHGKS